MDDIEPIAIKIFYSYARTKGDTPLRDELEKHLANLKRQGIISAWSDQDIIAGENREDTTTTKLEEADIILLLISPDFMYSDYCYSVELQKALEKHRTNKAEVIPIILRIVDWEGSPFSHLQALPIDAKPIKSWQDPDAAFFSVVQGIKAVVKRVLLQKHLMKIQELIERRELEKALLYCEKVIRINESASEVFFVKGEVLKKLARSEEALEAYKKASEINPKIADYYVMQGEILYNELARSGEALEACEKASEINPEIADYYAMQGEILYNKLDRSEEALEAYKKASALSPKVAAYHIKQAEILETWAQTLREKAKGL